MRTHVSGTGVAGRHGWKSRGRSASVPPLLLPPHQNISADVPVAIASEEPGGQCAQAVAGAFTRFVHVDLDVSAPKACFAAQHIQVRSARGGKGRKRRAWTPHPLPTPPALPQEVLAHSAAFIGTGRSTFSASVGWIRKYRHGFDPATTRLLDK